MARASRRSTFTAQLPDLGVRRQSDTGKLRRDQLVVVLVYAHERTPD
jgi:hypothetical protein